jgi:hypothetical protein
MKVFKECNLIDPKIDYQNNEGKLYNVKQAIYSLPLKRGGRKDK